MPDTDPKTADRAGDNSSDRASLGKRLADTISSKVGEPAPWFTIFVAVCGFLLIGIGYLAKESSPSFLHDGLLITVGSALILAAAGSAAVVRFKWAAAGGAAAIAIMLGRFFAVDPPYYVLGELKGSQGFKQVSVRAVRLLLVGRTDAGDHFRFVAFRSDLEGDTFHINAEDDKGDPREIVIGCIPNSLLTSRLITPRRIELSLARDADSKIWRLMDSTGKVEYGEWGNATCRVKNKTATSKAAAVESEPESWGKSHSLPTVISSAMAQTSGSVERIKSLLKQMDSDVLDERSNARAELAKLRDAESYRLMATAWNVDTSSYRLDLGVLVAWVSAIRQNREVAARLTGALDERQISYIVQLTGFPDQTMRYNATELLSWLLQATGWPSGASTDATKRISTAVSVVLTQPGTQFPFVAKASKHHSWSTNYAGVAFNTLVALDDAKCVMKPELRGEFRISLSKFEKEYLRSTDAPKAQNLLKGIQASACFVN